MGLHIFLSICPDVFLEMVASEIWRTSREKNKVEFSFHQVEVASYKFIMDGILIFVYLDLKLFHSKTVWKRILSIIDMFIFCLFILKLKFSIKRLFRARTSLTLMELQSDNSLNTRMWHDKKHTLEEISRERYSVLVLSFYVSDETGPY